jgi:hypothetical protein
MTNIITGYHQIYSENGELLSSSPIYSDIQIAKEKQIERIIEIITTFVESNFSRIEREQLLAINARLSINSMKGIANTHQEVFQYVDECLKFVEDMSLYSMSLSLQVMASVDHDSIVSIFPDFNDVVIPTKKSVAYLIQKLRE